jgi:Ca2+-binding RTX toxin-like protein
MIGDVALGVGIGSIFDSSTGQIFGNVIGGDGGNTLIGGTNATTIFGGAGADKISGGGSSDTFYGGNGVDTLDGGAGDDMLNGGTGADVIYGGLGSDTADYSSAAAAVSARLDYSGGQKGDAAGDIYFSVENLNGSSFADFFVGDANANVLSGGGGADTLFAGDGNDTIWGGDGADFLVGQGGNDLLIGQDGDDFLVFDPGMDVGYGGAGVDAFYWNSYKQGADIVGDFSHADGDKIYFDHTAFGVTQYLALTQGTNFFVGAGVTSTQARATVYFDTNANALYFDADGTGTAATQVIAFIGNGAPGLVASDFVFS